MCHFCLAVFCFLVALVVFSTSCVRGAGHTALDHHPLLTTPGVRALCVHVRRRRRVDDTVFDSGVRARVWRCEPSGVEKEQGAPRGFERRRVDRVA